MTPDEHDVLAACFEARFRQREMLPLIATALGVSEGEVFYTWALNRTCRQGNAIPGTAWRFQFHGLDCDLWNTDDGRFLRYDFGPGGRADCVSPWGVLQFVMASHVPWMEFPALRERLADKSPPYNHLSGSHQKMSRLWDQLERKGCFECADATLAEFLDQHTTIGSDGMGHVSYSEEMPREKSIDMLVARRRVLTARAHQLLKSGPDR